MRISYRLHLTFPAALKIINSLGACNLKSRRAVRKFDLTEKHAVDRLPFVTSVDESFDWEGVIFSDGDDCLY